MYIARRYLESVHPYCAECTGINRLKIPGPSAPAFGWSCCCDLENETDLRVSGN